VLKHEVDAEETTFLDAEALGQVQRVVIPSQVKMPRLAEKLRDFRGWMIADRIERVEQRSWKRLGSLMPKKRNFESTAGPRPSGEQQFVLMRWCDRRRAGAAAIGCGASWRRPSSRDSRRRRRCGDQLCTGVPVSRDLEASLSGAHLYGEIA